MRPRLPWIALGAAVVWGAISATPVAAEPRQLAVGTSLTLQQRDDYGSGSRTAIIPELVAFKYQPLPYERLFLRPGVRVGFAGLNQAEMPQSVQIREYDLTVAAEAGVVRDGVVIPNAAVGIGGVVRWLRYDIDEPVAGGRDARLELMPAIYAQAGLDVPLARGALLLGPIARLERVLGDDRIRWRLGIDATLALW